MNLPTELNIKITHEGSTIRLSLPELGITTAAGDLWDALDDLKEKLSEGFLGVIDANDGRINEFVETCIKGDDEDVDFWLEEARWQRRQRIFEAALVRHYPALKDGKFIRQAYPTHLDDGEENAAREKAAQDELMATGPGPLWISYIRYHAEWDYWAYKSRYQAAAKYQRYLDHGFELRPIDELEDEGRPKGIIASVEVISWGDLRR